MTSQTTDVLHSNFAACIVFRRYKPCEFLGFVWTDYWGNKSDYVITSPANKTLWHGNILFQSRNLSDLSFSYSKVAESTNNVLNVMSAKRGPFMTRIRFKFIISIKQDVIKGVGSFFKLSFKYQFWQTHNFPLECIKSFISKVKRVDTERKSLKADVNVEVITIMFQYYFTMVKLSILGTCYK